MLLDYLMMSYILFEPLIFRNLKVLLLTIIEYALI